MRYENIRVVINASPLIFLSKLNSLELLFQVFAEIYVPNQVLEEVFKDEDKHDESLWIRKYLEAGNIKKKRVVVHKNFEELGLDDGEKAVLLLAKKMNIEIVIVDDYAAIKTAKYFNLRPYSTPFVLLMALKLKKINFETFKGTLDRLLHFNYRISPALYLEILEKAKKFR